MQLVLRTRRLAPWVHYGDVCGTSLQPGARLAARLTPGVGVPTPGRCAGACTGRVQRWATRGGHTDYVQRSVAYYTGAGALGACEQVHRPRYQPKLVRGGPVAHALFEVPRRRIVQPEAERTAVRHSFVVLLVLVPAAARGQRWRAVVGHGDAQLLALLRGLGCTVR